uniref:Nup358 (inferred by orthology to a D. melanogaster protein) n=1 Tax=Strongyloides venezuelensis TaxID=75913 RepID=A0A0K0FXL7_STRVS
MSNISSEKETANIGDQISAYLKANTSALGELIRQMIYESNDTRRQLNEVKNSLEQVHEGLKILGERVAVLSVNDNSLTLEEVKQQHYLEMDRLVKVFEIATSLKKEAPANPQVSTLTPQQVLQIQQQQQQQMAAFQQQVIQQQNIARMMQMQQAQQCNPLSMLQGMVDSNNSKPAAQPTGHIVAQNQGQGNYILKSQLSQPPTVVPPTNVLTPTKKEEHFSVPPASQVPLFSTTTNTQSIFGKAQVQPKPFFAPTTVTEANDANKSTLENDDEAPEDFEPDVQFKPVVPLPDLVKVKTGEEDENVLFQEQCKLFRFDENLKEFKERGVGKIKILENKTTGVIRVVMRREQIHKVCANFLITKGMTIRLKSNATKVCLFKCFDNSDDEPAHVTLCAKFGDESHCSKFISIFSKAAENDNSGILKKSESSVLKSEVSKKVEVKEELSSKSILSSDDISKKGETQKFSEDNDTQEDGESDDDEADESYGSSAEECDNGGSQSFKVPEKVEGSWNCESCYVDNPPTTSKCLCCDAVRGGKVSSEKPKATLKGNVFTSPISTQFSFGFGSSTSSSGDDKSKSIFGTKTMDNEAKAFEGINLSSENKESAKPFSIFSGNTESTTISTPTSGQNKQTDKGTTLSFGSTKGSDNTSSLDSSTNVETPKQVPFSFAGVAVKPSDKPSPFQFTPGKTPNSSFSLFGGAKSNTPSNDNNKSLFGQTSFGGSLKDTPKTSDEKTTATDVKSVFGQSNFGASIKDTSKTSEEKETSGENKPVFGKSIFGVSTDVKSVFGKNTFGASLSDTSEQGGDQGGKTNENKILFGKPFSFGKKDESGDDSKSAVSTAESSTFGGSNTKPIFGSSTFGSNVGSSVSGKTDATNSETTTNKSGGVFGGGSQIVSFSTVAKSGGNFLSGSTKNEGDPFKVDPSKHKVFSSTEDKGEKNDKDEGNEEDDYQPDIYFEPVIPLPDLIDVKTGEEDEEKVLSHKVRLYIMKTESGRNEWKERGTGELRLLKHPETNSHRIVMRRDQTQKLCANMRLYKHMKFTYNQTKDKVVLFKATDCSDDIHNTIPETYCIRFSSSDDAVKFCEVANNIAENII